MAYEIMDNVPMPGKPVNALVAVLCEMKPDQCLKTGSKRTPRRFIKMASERCGGKFYAHRMKDGNISIWCVSVAPKAVDE